MNPVEEQKIRERNIRYVRRAIIIGNSGHATFKDIADYMGKQGWEISVKDIGDIAEILISDQDGKFRLVPMREEFAIMATDEFWE